MTQYSAWFNDKTYNAVDDRYGMISALWDGVGGVTPLDSVHAQPGVVPTVGTDGMKVVQHAAGANMSVDVSPGHVIISKTGDIRGSYMGVNDAVKNLTVSAADVTNPRIDSVFATITDQDYGDSTSGYATVIVTGTAALSPVAPTAPPGVVYYLKLADIAVAANVTSIVTANITGRRVYATPTASAGRTTQGAAPTNQSGNGSHWYNPTADTLEWGMNGHTTILGPPGGYGWNSYTPVLTASTTNPTLGSGSTSVGEWRYMDNGDWIICQGKITFGTSGVAAGSGTYQVSLPKAAGSFGASPIQGKALLRDSSASGFMNSNLLCNSGDTKLDTYCTQTSSGGANFTSNTFPWTWAAGDSITWSIIYPASTVI